jgi:hypothetical protein
MLILKRTRVRYWADPAPTTAAATFSNCRCKAQTDLTTVRVLLPFSPVPQCIDLAGPGQIDQDTINKFLKGSTNLPALTNQTATSASASKADVLAEGIEAGFDYRR